ncbi:hypothetical protein F511_43391 [Dorcoceras hygrometricum]|uniref:Uncharacterized protein n=1 Tax=Dorcoceras hygrometricum TaxID=472368 RepID=A0A2Z7CN64_9LAMI|nr:hypothetical protein F511_43391 [Dorcoceras hygrometricum]
MNVIELNLFYRIDRLPAHVFRSSADSPGGVIRIPNKYWFPNSRMDMVFKVLERKKNTKSYSANSSPLPSFLAVDAAAARRRHRNLFRPSRRGDSVREIFVDFLVQTDEGVEILVVDRIRRRSSRSTVEVPILSWNWSEPDA